MNFPFFRIDYGPAFRAAVVERRTFSVPFPLRALEGRTILFMSDLHLSRMFPESAGRRLVSQAASLRPDLVLLGGDFAETAADQERLAPLLAGLRPSLGAFAVPGNNDYEHFFQNGRSLADALGAIGVSLLVDSEACVETDGCRIRIFGFNSLTRYTTPAAPPFGHPAENELRILMAHYPQSLQLHRLDCRVPPHLAFAGHTHGGQIRFFGLTPFSFGFERRKKSALMPVRGWTDAPGFPTLISPGVGTSRLPFRLNAPPTIHLITLAAPQEDN